MNNPNIKYELFTRHIYEVLINNTSPHPINVKQNVKIKGRSGNDNQIDVYFELENNNTIQPVVIECKNYNSLVPVSRVRDFYGVLNDIGGNIKGIMVSKKGFQKGAKQFAKTYGISLVELREVPENEIIGAIQSHHYLEKIHHLYRIDEAFARNNNININQTRKFYSYLQPEKADYWLNSVFVPLETEDSIIYDYNGKYLSSLKELDKNTPFRMLQDYVIGFSDGWVKTRQWGMVKINSVKIESEVDEQDIIINLEANGFVEAIIKDVLSNESRYVTKY